METLVKLVAQLLFLYLVFALVCLAVAESISELLGTRGKLLGRRIVAMLGEGDSRSLLEHPIIKPLGGKRFPTYIPSRLFALAILDLLVPNSSEPIRLADLTLAVQRLPSHMRRSWIALLRSSHGDIGSILKAIENWFNDVMDAVSGDYRRTLQFILVTVSLVLTISLNMSTIDIVNCGWAQYVGGSGTPAPYCSRLVGWSHGDIPRTALQLLGRVTGWLLTTILLAILAQVLFDFLRYLVRIRFARQPLDPKS